MCCSASPHPCGGRDGPAGPFDHAGLYTVACGTLAAGTCNL